MTFKPISDKEGASGFEYMLKLMDRWRLGIITVDESADLKQLTTYFKDYIEVLAKSLE